MRDDFFCPLDSYSCLGLAALVIIYLTIQHWSHQDIFYTDIYKRRGWVLQMFHVSLACKEKKERKKKSRLRSAFYLHLSLFLASPFFFSEMSRWKQAWPCACGVHSHLTASHVQTDFNIIYKTVCFLSI